MSKFLAELGKEGILPIITAYVALMWKYLSKEQRYWRSDDRLLVSEFLVACLFVQLSFLVSDLQPALSTGLTPHQTVVLSLRFTMLIVVGLLLAASALALRQYVDPELLKRSTADRLSACAGLLLFFLTAFNLFLDLGTGCLSSWTVCGV